MFLFLELNFEEGPTGLVGRKVEAKKKKIRDIIHVYKSDGALSEDVTTTLLLYLKADLSKVDMTCI